jgi:hypothetical protein
MSLQGEMLTDTICFGYTAPTGDQSEYKSSDCTDDYSFFTISQQSGFYANGLLGLAPYSSSTEDNSLVKTMYENGDIPT